MTSIYKIPFLHETSQFAADCFGVCEFAVSDWLCSLCASAFAENHFHAGLLFDEFPLTLEAAIARKPSGRFFIDQQKGFGKRPGRFRRCFRTTRIPRIESREDDFLYPLLTYERYGHGISLAVLSSCSVSSGGQQPDGSAKTRFTLFPLYFQQRSPDTNENYTALVPFYGHLKNRLLRDEIFFVMFPIYSETRKRDVVTDNYLYPFFHVRHGDGLHGWQFWPLVGARTQSRDHANQRLRRRRNHRRPRPIFCALAHSLLAEQRHRHRQPGKIPRPICRFTAIRARRNCDSTSVLWPFFTWIDEREKKYHEWQAPWPFVIFARGEGKTTSRVLPLFSRSHNDTMESDSYLWPLYRPHGMHADPLDSTARRASCFICIRP